MAGLYFEQFSVGQTFVHEIRRTVTDMDNILFSSLTCNPAAVHIDHEYAEGHRVRKAADELDLHPRPYDRAVGPGHDAWEPLSAIWEWRTRGFRRPVFAGDTLRAETKVIAVRESKSRPTQGIVTFEHRGLNQRDEEVVYCCRRNALMMRQPA